MQRLESIPWSVVPTTPNTALYPFDSSVTFPEIFFPVTLPLPALWSDLLLLSSLPCVRLMFDGADDPIMFPPVCPSLFPFTVFNLFVLQRSTQVKFFPDNQHVEQDRGITSIHSVYSDVEMSCGSLSSRVGYYGFSTSESLLLASSWTHRATIRAGMVWMTRTINHMRAV